MTSQGRRWPLGRGGLRHVRGPHSAAPRMRDRGAPAAHARPLHAPLASPVPPLARQSAAGRRQHRASVPRRERRE
ncbi:unnamed protein product, partial [Iphiclides podalirius]